MWGRSRAEADRVGSTLLRLTSIGDFPKSPEILLSCDSLAFLRGEVFWVHHKAHPAYVQTISIPAGTDCPAVCRFTIGVMFTGMEELFELVVIEKNRLPVPLSEFRSP